MTGNPGIRDPADTDLRFERARGDRLDAMRTIAVHTVDRDFRTFAEDGTVDWYLSGPLDEFLAESVGDTTLAMVGDRVVGFAVCKGNRIDLILVDRDAQGHGIGSALLAHCEADLFRRHETLRLESFEGNGKANGFYRKNGWVRVDAVPDAMGGARRWVLEKRRDR